MLLLVDTLSYQGITHDKGWNVTRGDTSVDFRIDSEAQEVIEASTDFDSRDHSSFDEVLRLLK